MSNADYSLKKMNAKSFKNWELIVNFVSCWMIRAILSITISVIVFQLQSKYWLIHLACVGNVSANTIFLSFGQHFFLYGTNTDSWIQLMQPSRVVFERSDVTPRVSEYCSCAYRSTLDCRTSREPSIFLDVCSSLVVFFAVVLALSASHRK